MTPDKGYIFSFNENEKKECIDRGLAGVTEKSYYYINGIEPGCPLFLYNYTTGNLEGIYKAEASPQHNVIPEAWNGKFPVQVKMSHNGVSRSFTRKEIEGIVPFNKTPNTEFPYNMLTGETLKKLLELFAEPAIVSLPTDFRKKYPCNHHCSDGHKVRSGLEQLVDEWLFRNRIAHGYERKLPIPENAMCDFWIPTKTGDVYIEVWGIEGDENYQKYKSWKQSLYKKRNLTLIELSKEEVNRVDDVLPQRLLGVGVGV